MIRFYDKRPGFMRLACFFLFVSLFSAGTAPAHPLQEGLALSPFDIDVTPPVGSPLAYDLTENSWNLGLRARGVVLQGAGLPIVLCALDWIAIGNEGMDDFKRALAAAADRDGRFRRRAARRPSAFAYRVKKE